MASINSVKLEGQQSYVQCTVCGVVAVADNQEQATMIVFRHLSAHPDHHNTTSGKGETNFRNLLHYYKRVDISTL